MALVIAAFLIATLLIAGNWPAGAPRLPAVSPLDVDQGIPFPEASQASSVFSLTALFGPYLGLSILFGLPAFVGLFLGTALGLILLCRYFSARSDTSFHAILQEYVADRSHCAKHLALFIALTQACFATSELLILREISASWMQMGKDNAAIFSVFVALVGYLYCLRGGYIAVFRTDIVQFFFVLAMAITLAVLAFHHLTPDSLRVAVVGSDVQIWFSSIADSVWHPALTAAVCMAMGLAFVIASPDIWKRVFVVTSRRAARPFLRLVIVGSLPFIVITPILCLPRSSSVDDLAHLQFLADAVSTAPRAATIIVVLGLVAAFLSSFDSALVASTHCALLPGHSTCTAKHTRKGYHKTIGLTFLSINLLFILLPYISITNPYFLANVLVANYAVIAGVLLASKGLRARALSPRMLLGVAIPVVTLWTTYLAGGLNLFRSPAKGHIESVPIGAVMFLAIAVFSWVLCRKRKTDGQSQAP